jgi:hypothetical protein
MTKQSRLDEDEQELTEAELRMHLSNVSDWIRVRMQGHIDPPDGNATYLVKSERDVSEMVEAYLGKLFHFLFPLSSPRIPPHNTVPVNREASIDVGKGLRRKFNLGDGDDFIACPSQVTDSLKKLRDAFNSWFADPNSSGDNPRYVWAGCHLWLERRIATGFRLLFLDGQNWQPKDASWSLTRLVHDWPSTLTRSVFQYFQGADDPFVNIAGAGEVCTALCAFDNEEEKHRFERISRMREGEYIYLWTGQDSGLLSDFADDLLVWFRDTGCLKPNQELPHEPLSWLGNNREARDRWALLKDDMPAGLAADSGITQSLKIQSSFTEYLAKLSGQVDEAPSSLRRCHATLERILNLKENYTLDDCFWALQSVMFYDWKYWYLFPFSYERQPCGGIAVSSGAPLSFDKIRLLTIYMSKVLEVFVQTEDWARNRLRQRKASNLLKPAELIRDAWAKQIEAEKEIEDHKRLFIRLLGVVLNRPVNSASEPTFLLSDLSSREREYRRLVWEDQRDNVLYAVINYWTSLLPDRVFAPHLSHELGDSAPGIWDRTWETYKEITAIARKDFDYYTFNDFLFEKAPRKAIVEWRWLDGQTTPRSQDHPANWVSEPPSITPDVARILFGDIEFSSDHKTVDIGSGIRRLQQRVDSIAPQCEDQLSKYLGKLAHFTDHDKITLGIYEGDGECLERALNALVKNASDLEQTRADRSESQFEEKPDFATSLAAEYLVRLALYLNVQMNTLGKDEQDDSCFADLSRCAFFSAALYKYYRPDLFRREPPVSEALEESDEYSYFYSIPIEVAGANEAGVSRSSILSLGTMRPLTPAELNLWRDIGKEIVVPAMLIDLKHAVKEQEQRIASQEKEQEIIKAQREMARKQVPAALHSARRLVGETREKLDEFAHWIKKEAEFEDFAGDEVRKAVLGEVSIVQRQAEETQTRISRLNDIAKHFHESRIFPNKPGPLGFPAYSSSGRTSIREIILRAIALPLNLNIREVVSLDTDISVAKYLRNVTNFTWNIDLTGVRDLFEHENSSKRTADQIDCWRILFEEWAANLRGGWVKSGGCPYVNWIIREGPQHELVCVMTNGPIPPNLEGNVDRTSGIGTMEIEWCVYGLSGFDFSEGPEDSYWQGPDRDDGSNDTVWKTQFMVPPEAIEKGIV